MSEQEKFLGRWSRRKQEAGKADAEQPPTDAAEDPQAIVASEQPADEEKREATEFDLSKLPTLESITGSTDIKAFLSAGVPAHLTRAALRNAWAADPAIRDFVGLSENAWDFNDPNSIPGFGTIDSPGELRKMVEQVFGEMTKAPENKDPAPPESPNQTADDLAPEADATPSAGSEPADEAETAAAPDAPATVEDVAVQDDHQPAHRDILSVRRRHGGALPS